MIPAAILDTTLLSNFSHLERPELMRWAAGDNLATTPNAISELRVGESEGTVPTCDWTWLTIVELSQAEQILAKELSERLGPGESECLAVAIQRQCLFFSDDLDARRLAKQRGIRISGTIGILLKLVHDQRLTLSHADTLLGTLIAAGYRSPVQSLVVVESGP